MNGFAVPGVALRGVTGALPRQLIDNRSFIDRWGEKAVADVTAMTGVETRYWADPAQTAGDLCFTAADRLLETLGWARDSLDALILVTQTPDQRMPATACSLHGRLGLSQRCQAFDVALGCSGYVYGLWIAAAMLAAGCKRILLLAGDTSSRMIDPTDRSTAMLFGDAGSASALEHAEGAEPIRFVLGTDGTGAHHLGIEGGGFRPPAGPVANDALTMDGAEVFAFTLRAVPALVRALLDDAGRTTDQVDVFALHQANRFMLRHVGKKLGVGPDRMPVNIERFGNTSSASIPLLLATDLAPRLLATPSDTLLAGFGVGFSWGAAFLPAARLHCAELVAA